MKKELFPILLFAFLTACGDDSSTDASSESNDSRVSSSSIESENPSVDNPTEPSNPENPNNPESPQSSATESLSSSSVEIDFEYVSESVSASSAYACSTSQITYMQGFDVYCDGSYLGQIIEDTDASPYVPTEAYYDFVSLPKVYAGLQANERVVILLRHAARTSSTDHSGILTGLGEHQAMYVGSLIADSKEIFYYHSDVLRTEQTCHKIAQGRAQESIKHATIPELSGSFYVKDSELYAKYEEEAITSYDLIASYAYKGEYADAHYDLSERSEELLSIIKKMLAANNISIAVSHDQLLVPFIVYLTNAQIDLRYFDNKYWLNFLAGIAIIQSADGSLKFVPVKGLDTGLL